MNKRRGHALVSGSVARDAFHGGAAWAVMQYALGLTRLGFDTYVVEPAREPNAAFRARFSETLSEFGLPGRLIDNGYSPDRYDLVLNISGMLPALSIARIPIRIYVDLDPAFNQFWHDGGIDRGFDGHTHFVTVGQAIGTPGCDVPTFGLDWIGTLPPVVTDYWPAASAIDIDGFTSVGNLRSYGSIERGGVLYGQKVHTLRNFYDLPVRSTKRFVLAMGIDPKESTDLARLRKGGWEFVDPQDVAPTASAYRSFIQGSRAEIGIAKSGYVASRCGWFSDRSACYLMSGRPVLAQDTGFSSFLPVGEGLLAFDNIEGALDGAEEISRNYNKHSRAARDLAEACFASDVVLKKILNAVEA